MFITINVDGQVEFFKNEPLLTVRARAATIISIATENGEQENGYTARIIKSRNRNFPEPMEFF